MRVELVWSDLRGSGSWPGWAGRHLLAVLLATPDTGRMQRVRARESQCQHIRYFRSTDTYVARPTHVTADIVNKNIRNITALLSKIVTLRC